MSGVFWSIPRLWSGATVAILGAGPSLDPDQVSACASAGWKIIACNLSYKLIPEDYRPGSWLHGCDIQPWCWYVDMKAFPGIKTTLAPEISTQGWGIKLLRDAGTSGFCAEPDSVTTGNCSGYQAIHIAAHAGASRVILLGMDMTPGHWHPPHPDGMSEHGWGDQLPLFQTLVEPLAERGIDVLNATPGSAIDAFPRVDLASLLP
jgi:hypothetical protein